jgi:hypothetical protein
MSNCLCPITLTPELRECPSIGGVLEVYIAERCDVGTLTLSGDTITSIAMVGAATYSTFQQRKNVANMTTTTAKDATSGVVTHTTDVNLKFNKLTAASRLNFIALANGETSTIVKLNDGTYWMVGDNTFYTEMSAGTINSGVAFTDASGYDVTLQVVSNYPPKQVSMATISTILDSYAS